MRVGGWELGGGGRGAVPLRLIKPANPAGGRVGILAAAFNPPTVAHLAMAREAAARFALDEVLFLLPEVFPHKAYSGASFGQRREMLEAALAGEPRFSIGSCDAGLFIEIARACRPVYGPGAELFFLCGRDAAERIVNWDYGPAEIPFARQLEEFRLLVAPRGGHYAIPVELAARIHALDLPPALETVSSSAVRWAIAVGRPWEDVVPAPVAATISLRRLFQTPQSAPTDR